VQNVKRKKQLKNAANFNIFNNFRKNIKFCVYIIMPDIPMNTNMCIEHLTNAKYTVTPPDTSPEVDTISEGGRRRRRRKGTKSRRKRKRKSKRKPTKKRKKRRKSRKRKSTKKRRRRR